MTKPKTTFNPIKNLGKWAGKPKQPSGYQFYIGAGRAKGWCYRCNEEHTPDKCDLPPIHKRDCRICSDARERTKNMPHMRTRSTK